MAKLARVTGVTKVLLNLAKFNANLNPAIAAGFMKGGLFLQRESMKIVPVDKNVLRPSANTRQVGETHLGKIDVVISYSTEYAVHVHEDLDARHKQGKQAKFLEQPAREKKDEIFKIIHSTVLKRIR